MEATELRIGNYVYIGKFSVPRLGITSDGNTQITGEGISYVEQKLLDVLPIPLTEEWLLGFGFHKEFNDDEDVERKVYYLNNCDDSFYVDFDLGGYDEWYIGVSGYGYIRGIKHVHQLQNLYFALTKKELTIKE